MTDNKCIYVALFQYFDNYYLTHLLEFNYKYTSSRKIYKNE